MAKKKKDAKALKFYPPGEADEELTYLLRARYNLLYVVTWEERRLLQSLKRICDLKHIEICDVHIWDGALGMVNIKNQPVPGTENVKTFEQALNYIMRQAEEQRGLSPDHREGRGPIYVLCDVYRFLSPDRLNPFEERKVRALSRLLGRTTMHVVMTSPVLELPTSLEKCVTVVDYPLPGREQMSVVVENAKRQINSDSIPKENLEEVPTPSVVDALLGLTVREAEDALAKALVKTKRFDIPVLHDIKRQVIRKGQLLDYMSSDETMDSVGGFEGVKEFMRLRRSAFSQEAADYGLPAPKGIFLLGVQGTGKSLCAKAVANELQVPLLKLEMGRMMSRWLGDTDKNLRRALELAESIAPCVMFIDEVNMALSNSGSADQGHETTRRAVGHLLDWMQSKTSPVFVMACANSIDGIPPAILRKGRFDELFFVDLPSERNRREIFEIHVSKRGRDPAGYDLGKLAAMTPNFSGAEIENVVVDAMYMAYSDGPREFTTEDMETVVGHATPLANLEVMKEDIDALRDQSQGRMRDANAPLYRREDPDGAAGGSRFDGLSAEGGG